MRLRLPDCAESGERGAIAVITALLAVVLLGVVAIGVDFTMQVNEREKLHDTIDAAAHAGAYRLPDGAAAKVDAQAFAVKNDPAATPAIDLFCVVASQANGSLWAVNTNQIPATCNPASRKVGATYPTARCNSMICAIPCPAVGDVCNTVSVSDDKVVPFSFAPVIGINQGSTGGVTSVACKGPCGAIPLNPMDVAIVADRTGSMSSSDITAMITGIKGMFQVMTPSQQYVALGTIGRSSSTAPTNCKSARSSTAATGPWMPVPFTADYLTAGNTLVKAVECLNDTSGNGSGTHLASPMKAAARYLLGPSSPYDSSNNISSLPARVGTIRKAIIFETDGLPNESNFGGSTALTDSADIGNTNGVTACANFTTVANNTKIANILVVTVAFNISTTDKCGGTGARLDETLATAATPVAPGVNSAANFNCADASVGGGRDKENADGDYFFCAGTGTDMAAIFKTALGRLATGVRLIQLP
jgi:Flp pilus assembly protein TadG